MKLTRTNIFANVVYEKVYKDEEGKIVQETLETTIPNCSTEEKAYISLTKENKGSIISIVSVAYVKRTYEVDTAVFYANATITKEVEYDSKQEKNKKEEE